MLDAPTWNISGRGTGWVNVQICYFEKVEAAQRVNKPGHEPGRGKGCDHLKIVSAWMDSFNSGFTPLSFWSLSLWAGKRGRTLCFSQSTVNLCFIKERKWSCSWKLSFHYKMLYNFSVWLWCFHLLHKTSVKFKGVIDILLKWNKKSYSISHSSYYHHFKITVTFSLLFISGCHTQFQTELVSFTADFQIVLASSLQ